MATVTKLAVQAWTVNEICKTDATARRKRAAIAGTERTGPTRRTMNSATNSNICSNPKKKVSAEGSVRLTGQRAIRNWPTTHWPEQIYRNVVIRIICRVKSIESQRGDEQSIGHQRRLIVNSSHARHNSTAFGSSTDSVPNLTGRSGRRT